ncbi:hypothetical protein AB0H28_02295 [Micromonospora sp. NPDC050980]|uniref:NADPH-dependent FMN reductase n=1 Tax=Micromonospora sp. NPDC050980 TaxID=3155161 RepID=UPI0033C6DCBD
MSGPNRRWLPLVRVASMRFVSYGAGSGGIRAVEQLRLVYAELHATTTRSGVVLSMPWERLDRQGRLVADEPLGRAADATLDELSWWARRCAAHDAAGRTVSSARGASGPPRPPSRSG